MKPLLKLTLLLLLPLTTLAHGYWMEVKGSHTAKEPATIRLYFGEYVTGERLSGNFLDRMKDIKVYVQYNGTKEIVTMTQQNDYWEGSYTPQTEGTYEIMGINDEREVQDWTRHNLGIVRPIQYLKTIYQVGARKSPATPTALLDIIVSGDQSKYSITLYKNNQAYNGAEITVTHPDGEETNLQTDHEGNAVFEIPKPGMYVIDAEWVDTRPGQFKGKDYATVRHKLDYTLDHL